MLIVLLAAVNFQYLSREKWNIRQQNAIITVRIIGVWAPPDLGDGDVLARKNYAMPERVGIETGMQTETFIIFSSNETAIVGKIAQLKVCILNSINSLDIIDRIE